MNILKEFAKIFIKSKLDDEKQKLKDKLQKVLSKDFVPASYSMDEYNWDTIAEQVLALYRGMV